MAEPFIPSNLIRTDPFNHALPNKVYADGYRPSSTEWPMDGRVYMLATNALGRERTYSAKIGDYKNVTWSWTPIDTEPINVSGLDHVQITNIVDKLHKSKDRAYTRRPLASITTAIIHHSACCNPSTDKTPAQIANYHVYTHKWPGIGYHFLIDEEGKAYQTNWLSHISYHAQQTNPYSLGICLLGNFTQLTPTNPQLTTTSKLLLKLRKSLPNLHQTKPHNHVVPSTACPGATSNQWLGEITLQSDPASQPPPKTAGKNYDLLPYLRGNTETLYELTHHAKDGQQSTHRVQTQRNGDKEWFITKGNEHHAEFEHLFLMNNNRQIGRGADTSMGILNGRRRAYTIFQNGRYGAPWINRHMVIGESFFGDNHEVRAFYIDDCSYSALNSGTARNHTTLKNIYPTHTLPNGKIIEDVAHIYNVVNGRPSEHYFFAKNIGLIQWENERGDKSYLGEIHAPGARPFNNREPMPPCATVY